MKLRVIKVAVPVSVGEIHILYELEVKRGWFGKWRRAEFFGFAPRFRTIDEANRTKQLIESSYVATISID